MALASFHAMASILLLLLSRTAGQPPLPALRIVPPVTVSGISSGADFAVQLHVAFSDLITGSGVFAGDAYGCETHLFRGENASTCAAQPANLQGAGCVCISTLPAPAPCQGCAPGATNAQNHCKTHPGVVDIGVLAAAARSAAARGAIAPLAGLARARVYGFRGLGDPYYADGSVQAALALFAALGAPAAALAFEGGVPTLHALPTVDPWLPPGTCCLPAAQQAACQWPPAMANCGFDGAGAALAHLLGAPLAPPAGPSDPANVFAFNQTLYEAGGAWPALADVGYLYVPPRCAGGAAPCRLHVALHGCGMYAGAPRMNSSFYLHAGFNPHADANDLVVLYPQGGGCALRRSSVCARAAQAQEGCWDSFGQTGPAFAEREGPQMAAVRAMIRAVSGL